MRILFLTHYYPPEVGAPQARISELARLLSEFGHQVEVLTCFPNYPTGVIPENYRNRWLMKEVIDEIAVTRTYVYATPNKGFFSRILNHFSFAVSCFIGLKSAGKFNVVITECPPLFLGFSGVVVSKLRKAKHVFNVADLWPESAIELGQLKSRFLIWLSQRLASFIYEHSDLITVTADGQQQRLLRRGIDSKRISVIPNGVDVQQFRPEPRRDGICIEYSLNGKFVLFYGGTLGLAQSMRTIVEAARILRAKEDVVFVLSGEGAEKTSLTKLVRTNGITNVLFLDPVPRRDMAARINSIDVGLVSLRKLDIFRGVLPSKMFEFMSCGKPVIGAVQGDCRDVIVKSDCGVAVEPESPDQLAEAVLRLYGDKALRERLGANGRQYVMANHSRLEIARKLEKELLADWTGSIS